MHRNQISLYYANIKILPELWVSFNQEAKRRQSVKKGCWRDRIILCIANSSRSMQKHNELGVVGYN